MKVLPLQGFASREACLPFSFHLIQLFFNFFKYLFLNFISFYLNKIFTIYFFSSSLLLKTPVSGFNAFFFLFSFLICILLIFSSLISFSNSSTKSITFPKFSNLSQVSFSTIYLFYITKYFGFPLTSLLFNIFSTSYSFFLFISIRGGEIFYLFTCF